jgi:hypothetical protein
MTKFIRIVILLISVTTVLSGAIQVMMPSFVLQFVGARIDTTTSHLFATIGMFMFLFGAMMIHALYNEENNRVAVIWSGLQKLGASVAVFTGIFNGVFVTLAAGVAIFDLVSALLFFYYLKTLKENAVG